MTSNGTGRRGYPRHQQAAPHNRAGRRPSFRTPRVSIDGYVAALDGSHPWNDGSEDEAVKRWILDSVWAAGAHLMGRVTYEEMAAFWPTSTNDYGGR